MRDRGLEFVDDPRQARDFCPGVLASIRESGEESFFARRVEHRFPFCFRFMRHLHNVGVLTSSEDFHVTVLDVYLGEPEEA